MAHDNHATDLDEVGINLEPIPHIIVQAPSFDEEISSDQLPQEGLSTKIHRTNRKKPVTHVDTLDVSSDTSPPVITEHISPNYTVPLRRRIFNSVLGFAKKLGSGLEHIGIRNATVKTIRFAVRTQCQGLFKERVNSIVIQTLKIGNDKSIKLKIYSPLTEPEQANEPRAVLFYIHGNLPFTTVNCYHSFLLHLCKDLSQSVKTTHVSLVAFDFDRSPEKTFIEILDDCIYVIENFLRGEFATDFENIGLNIDRKRIMIAGDAAGATIAFAVALELSKRKLIAFAFVIYSTLNSLAISGGDEFDSDDEKNLPKLHAVILLNPPLQAITTQMFESHVLFLEKNCSVLSHRLGTVLPYYIGLQDGLPEYKAAKNMVKAERHIPNETRSRLLRRIFPRYESNSTRSQPEEIPTDFARLVTSTKIWPMLVKNKDLALLPDMFLQACCYDTLFDEQRLFSKKLRKICGVRFRFSEISDATHNECVNNFIGVKTPASSIAYRETLQYIIELVDDSPVSSPAPEKSNTVPE